MTATSIPFGDDPTTTPTLRSVFVADVRAKWTKLRSVRSTTWTLLATVGIAIGFGALVAVSQMNSWDGLDRAEQLRFDPTFFSLSGLWLAQLAVGVLGDLLMTSEYATGQIRATASSRSPSRSPPGGSCPPRRAAVFSVTPDPRSLAPWTGYGVQLAYVAVSLLLGGFLLHRRDA